MTTTHSSPLADEFLWPWFWDGGHTRWIALPVSWPQVLAGCPLHQGNNRKGQILLRGHCLGWRLVPCGLCYTSGEGYKKTWQDFSLNIIFRFYNRCLSRCKTKLNYFVMVVFWVSSHLGIFSLIPLIHGTMDIEWIIFFQFFQVFQYCWMNNIKM